MVSISQAPAPVAAPTHRPRLSLFVVCLGVMMSFINASSTISALAPIQDDLHVTESTLVWVTSAFTIAMASLVLTWGTVGELYGRRIAYLSGVSLMAAGSLVAALAGNAAVLIAGQAVIGIGAAAALPSGLAIVSVTFTEPRERTSAISIWASCAGLGLAIGPLVSGYLLDRFSWHEVYLTNVVLGVIAAALAFLYVDESRHPSRHLDPLGLVLATITAGSATYSIIEGGSSGFGQPRVLVALAIFAVSFTVFLRVESTHHDPMLDLRLFRSPSFSAVMLVSCASMFGFVGLSLLSVLYLERVAAVGAFETGVLLMPMMATYVVFSAFAARVVGRLGFTAPITVGLLLMSAGAFALAGTTADGDYAGVWPGLTLAGTGAALLIAPSTAAAVNSVSPLEAGMASATVNTFRQLGSMLGPAVLGTIATSSFPRLLAADLTSEGLPAATARQVTDAIAHGSRPAGDPGLARIVGDAVPQALTSALHQGFLTGAVALLVTAGVAAIFVRHRHADH